MNYHLGADEEDPSKLPDIFVLGPNGFRHPVPITKLGTKSYRGTIHIGDLQGLFRIRPLDESRAFPEVGFYQPEQELLDYGSNEFLLRSVAQFTGGRFNPQPDQVFDSGGRSQSSTLRLWPFLLGSQSRSTWWNCLCGKFDHGFQVECLREKVNQRDLPNAIALRDQALQIAR